MPKYNQETKEKALKMALEGVHLKTIQTELGPNPKATERYIVKAHKEGKIKFANYKEVLAELKKQGKAPKTLRQESVDKKKARDDKKKAQTQAPVEEKLE